MASKNITATIVKFEDIPRMIESGWEMVVFSSETKVLGSFGTAVMRKSGDCPCDAETGLEIDMKEKRGETLLG